MFRLPLAAFLLVASPLFAQPLQVTPLAGTGVAGFRDGEAGVAQLNYPSAAAADLLGRIYIADSQNHVIRVLMPWGEMRTFAGRPGGRGSSDGPANIAQFDSPRGVAVGHSGELYVADTGNHTIRRIEWDGRVTTIAGSARNAGWRDARGEEARFSSPIAVAVDSIGDVYVSDSINHVIRRVDRQGNVLTIAGQPMTAGFSDGFSELAHFTFPAGLAFDGRGALIVADQGNHAIRRVTINGVVSTIAGGSARGARDGRGGDAEFAAPSSVAFDKDGRILVSDDGNRALRVVDDRGDVSTLEVQQAQRTAASGTGTFSGPVTLFTDVSGRVLLVERHGHTLSILDRRNSRRRGVVK